MPIVGGSTKTVNDGLIRAQNEFKGIILGTVDTLDFANEIYEIMGTATWWDWQITSGTPFGTVANLQDYPNVPADFRSEEHTSELQSRLHLVCRLLLEKKKKHNNTIIDLSCYHT